MLMYANITQYGLFSNKSITKQSNSHILMFCFYFQLFCFCCDRLLPA